jgi:hypothetical protein
MISRQFFAKYGQFAQKMTKLASKVWDFGSQKGMDYGVGESYGVLGPF